MLNLPTKITFNGNEDITNRYMYSAGGQKLQVFKQDLSGEHITDYVGSNIYENGSLRRTLVDGGYIEDGNYYYFLTDHQGNTRVVSTAAGEVVQSNHYYPYGLSLGEGVDSSDQPYKYNGKELDLGRGLNLYDYGARLLASDWGRFTTIDPLSEKYPWLSPYAYCANNPIRFVDPDGRDLREAIRQLKESVSVELSIGVQFGATIEVSGRSIGGAVNLVSTNIGGIKDGELYMSSNENYSQGFSVGIGIFSYNVEESVEQISDNTATVTRSDNFSVGSLSIGMTEQSMALQTGATTWVKDSSEASFEPNVSVGVNAAAIVGAKIDADFTKIWTGIKELFKP